MRTRRITVDFLLRNIWFLRFLILASGMIMAVLLLAYTFIFSNTFLTVGNTTSYFPWSWDVNYTNSSVVMNYFGVGLFVSVSVLVVSTVVLLAWVIPEFRVSISKYTRRLHLSERWKS